MSQKILLTGLPRSGKSTLLNRLLEHVPKKQGFLTITRPYPKGLE